MTSIKMRQPVPIEYVVPVSAKSDFAGTIMTVSDKKPTVGERDVARRAATTTHALRFENVSKQFHERDNTIQALSNVTLEVGRGEIVALVGPNGAGKTTLIKILCGLVLPDLGSVLLDGQDTAVNPMARRSLGVVMEGDRDFYGLLSVAENLTYFAGMMGVPRREISGYVLKILRKFDLADLAGRQAKRLSRGQKQRLSLALGMLHSPGYLVLDEPTLGLDPLALEDLLDQLRDLRNGGIGLLVASHDLTALEKVADRVVILAGGAIRHQTRLDTEDVKSGALLDIFKSYAKGSDERAN